MRDSRLAPPGIGLDVGTVATLFRDHHGELVRLALLMVGDLPTAEDVVQDVNLVVLSGKPRSYGSWSKVAVERVSAVNGSLLGVEYRAAAHGGEGQPSSVEISPDPSGRYLLFSCTGLGGLYTGWLGQGKLSFPSRSSRPI
jgi:hypothetical protein